MRYLSQYQLSVADARALRLTDAYSLHRIVYDLFDDVREGKEHASSGILFADKGMRQGLRTVLILSTRLPRTAERGLVQTRELREAYLQHEWYTFEIVINPVRRDNASGKLIPIRGRESIRQWFQQKAPTWGFAPQRLEVKDVCVDCFDKNNPTGTAKATIARATLLGTLRVTGRAAFVHAAENGIGRARAFGCGLLQIVPCQ